MKSVKTTDVCAQLESLIDAYNMIPEGCTVLVACSGGADSICLLHGLLSLQNKRIFSLAVAHFNHQLRGEESQRDEGFVRDFVNHHCPCVPLFVGTAPVAEIAQKLGQGIEETARLLRYDFFKEVAETLDGAKIATAHTADDNAETVLMHLVRGSGLRGLSGIPPVRGDIIRPLLSTTRQGIEDYLKANHLSHVEDSSNGDKQYFRNRIRHDVMPVLRESNPNFLSRLEQTTALLREENNYLDALVSDTLIPIQVENAIAFSLSVTSLLSLPRPLALRGIQQLAMCCDPDITLALSHRLSVLQLCHNTSPSASLSLPSDLVAHRQYDMLILSRAETPPVIEKNTLSLPCTAEFGHYQVVITQDTYSNQVQTPFEFWLDSTLLGCKISLRQRETGDALQRKNRPNRSLKKIFIDEKIPLRVRDQLPVFTLETQIVAVAHLGVAEAFLPSQNSSAWHILITCK